MKKLFSMLLITALLLVPAQTAFATQIDPAETEATEATLYCRATLEDDFLDVYGICDSMFS